MNVHNMWLVKNNYFYKEKSMSGVALFYLFLQTSLTLVWKNTARFAYSACQGTRHDATFGKLQCNLWENEKEEGKYDSFDLRTLKGIHGLCSMNR